jgi:branched-subunit amino acid transport protein AzlD
MIQTSGYLLISILIMGAITYSLRLAPFVLFKSSEQTPSLINYLGKAMPSAIITMLILYSIRHVDFIKFPSGIPESIGIFTVVALHLWKRQYILSILGGTICYMMLLRVMS